MYTLTNSGLGWYRKKCLSAGSVLWGRRGNGIPQKKKVQEGGEAKIDREREAGRQARMEQNGRKRARAGSIIPDPKAKNEAPGHLERESTDLVDPASSHMLVSKIKPCMCKCILLTR